LLAILDGMTEDRPFDRRLLLGPTAQVLLDFGKMLLLLGCRITVASGVPLQATTGPIHLSEMR
jgi:hypothetical protein